MGLTFATQYCQPQTCPQLDVLTDSLAKIPMHKAMSGKTIRTSFPFQRGIVLLPVPERDCPPSLPSLVVVRNSDDDSVDHVERKAPHLYRAPRSKRSYQDRQSDDRVTRPPNAFILYRSHYCDKEKAKAGGETHHRELSRQAGAAWRSLPSDESLRWKIVAQRVKEEHKRQHPNYCYSPNDKTGRPKKKHRKSTKSARYYTALSPSPSPPASLDPMSPTFYEDEDDKTEVVTSSPTPVSTHAYSPSPAPLEVPSPMDAASLLHARLGAPLHTHSYCESSNVAHVAAPEPENSEALHGVIPDFLCTEDIPHLDLNATASPSSQENAMGPTLWSNTQSSSFRSTEVASHPEHLCVSPEPTFQVPSCVQPSESSFAEFQEERQPHLDQLDLCDYLYDKTVAQDSFGFYEGTELDTFLLGRAGWND